MSEFVERPEFDENGVPKGFVAKEQKKPRLPWYLLIGVLVVGAVVGLILYKKLHRTPKELCMYAVVNAATQGFGYEDLMTKEFDLRGVIEELQTKSYKSSLSASFLRSNAKLDDMVSGTPLESALTGVLDDINLLSGAGFSIENTRSEEALRSSLSASYGAIKLEVLQAYMTKDELAACSPKLSSKVLTLNTKSLLSDWRSYPQWEWLSAEDKTNYQGYVSMAEDLYEQFSGEVQKKRDLFSRFYADTGEFLEDILSQFTYEQMPNEGEWAEKRLYVLGEKRRCFAYRVTVDGEEITSILKNTFGFDQEDFAITGEHDESVVATLYMTKKAELASLAFSCKVTLQGVVYPLSVSLTCTGTKRSGDAFELRITGENDEPLLYLVKDSSKYDGVIHESGAVELHLAETEFTFFAESKFETKTKTFSVEFSLGKNGKDQYTGEIEGRVYHEEEEAWEYIIDLLTVTDVDSEYLSFKGKLTLENDEEGVEPLSGEELPVYTMTKEEFEALLEEGKSNLSTYTSLLDMLF